MIHIYWISESNTLLNLIRETFIIFPSISKFSHLFGLLFKKRKKERKTDRVRFFGSDIRLSQLRIKTSGFIYSGFGFLRIQCESNPLTGIATCNFENLVHI